ncbi:MAG: type I 3-dehydroquinate dehydratase [Candidatus Bathyarchaeota archaeon]|nr:type I 3-dehydroquinate dehydratase [Candidatus Bathyarchaeota archaeon]
MKPKICVSLLPRTNMEALSLIDKAETLDPDLIELRLDFLESTINFSELVAHGNKPKIATVLTKNQEKKPNITGPNQQKILLNAAKHGFEYVDVGLSSPNLKFFIKKINALDCTSIVSFHDFTGSLPLNDLGKILDKEISSGAEVCKIVTTANQIEDNIAILDFISQKSATTRLVCFCMGNLGKISRLLSPFYGSFFTFASLEKGSETAKGQLTIQEIKEIYKILE